MRSRRVVNECRVGSSTGGARHSIVDGVNQRAVFRAHVDRLHRQAAVLQHSLGAQQQPCTDGVEPAERATVDLDPGGARGIQRAQAGIEAAGLADDPEPADHQA